MCTVYPVLPFGFRRICPPVDNFFFFFLNVYFSKDTLLFIYFWNISGCRTSTWQLDGKKKTNGKMFFRPCSVYSLA
jgi:hypothetical protein